MARLIPKIEPSEIENPGERFLAQALVDQLPSRVDVFHSFNWLAKNRQGRLVEGECDFVLLDPANGMLYIEVKGGTLEYDPAEVEWLRVLPSGERLTLKQDPFAQVRRSMHEIAGRVHRGLREDEPPFTYGYAVAFPDCRYTGSFPAGIDPDLMLDAAKCHDLRTSVQCIFDRFRRPDAAELSERAVRSIHEALYPRFALLPVTWRRVEDQEERLRRVTAEQQRLLDFLGDRPLAAIRGVAGSGKTILALAKAQEAARRGMRTLFLCYNRPLRDWLAQAAPETFEGNLTIKTFHSLVNDVCARAAVSFQPGSNLGNTEYWVSHAPECLMEACDRLPVEDKFDAVIVDEGQDFHDLWWTSLDGVFRDSDHKGCYYVFFDPHQNLFVDNPAVPGELGEPFELPVNCRNTVRIAEHCAALARHPNRVPDGSPVGEAPEIVSAPTLREGFAEAGKRVRSWCMPNAGGMKVSQVAVLAPGSSERDWPKDFQTIPITRDFDQWRKEKGVLLTSWSRFKGLEADAIAILETPIDDGGRENANRYVARSRAKHMLTVIQVDSP